MGNVSQNSPGSSRQTDLARAVSGDAWSGVASAASARRFLAVFLAIALGLSLTIVLFNFEVQEAVVVADGSTAPESWAFNELPRVSKAFAVMRLEPRTAIIGNSRANYAYRPDHPGWGAGPVYNFGINGATLYEYRRFLSHTAASGRLKSVFLSFDLAGFTSQWRTRDDFVEAMLVTDENGRPKPLAGLDRALYWLSLDALRFSIFAAWGDAKEERERDRTRRDGLRDGGSFLDRAAADPDGQRGFFRSVDERLVASLDHCRGAPIYEPNRQQFRALIDDARRLNVALNIVIDPVHIRRLLIYWLTGGWDVYEQIKREVVETTARARAAGAQIRVFDFSGLSDYIVEPPAAPGEPQPLARYFFESSHFTPLLGDRILDGVLSVRPPEGDFGVELTPQNIDAVLTDQRTAIAAWIEANPERIAEIADLLARGCGS